MSKTKKKNMNPKPKPELEGYMCGCGDVYTTYGFQCMGCQTFATIPVYKHSGSKNPDKLIDLLKAKKQESDHHDE